MKNKEILISLAAAAALPFAPPSCNPSASDGGVYKTSDGGSNWNQVITIEESQNNLAKADISELMLDPNDPNVVFLSAKNQGLFVSNSFGESWKSLTPEVTEIYAFEPDPAKKGLFYASVSLGGRGKILKSENGGADWKEVYSEADSVTYIKYLTVDPFYENSLIAVNSKDLVMRSNDGGATWKATFPFPDVVVGSVFDPSTPDLIWATTERGLWYSDNGGMNFKEMNVNANGDMGNQFYFLRKTGNNIFLSTDKGLFQAVEKGRAWRKIITLNNPADSPTRTIMAFPDDPLGHWAIGAGMNLYITENAGENWKPIQFSIKREINAVVVKADDSNQILVGVATGQRSGF